MTFVGAGTGGAYPEIRVSSGGDISARLSGPLRPGRSFLLVVEETERNVTKSVLIQPNRDLDMGVMLIAAKQYGPGEWPRDTRTEVVEVVSTGTGRIWMDRNLGAGRAAESSADQQTFGHLYQWGRPADGHQHRNSSTTSTLSTTNQPGHGRFIVPADPPMDWRSPQNEDLWQGADGINNPCPDGFRLPTAAEWVAERESWDSNNAGGALSSPLKLPMVGYRFTSGGTVLNEGYTGYYWSSSVNDTNSMYLVFENNSALSLSFHRALGFSVRCIRD